MKKFFYKIVSFVIIVTVITVFINSIYVNTNNSNAEELKFKNVPKEINICNFGSSHGLHGFYYKDIEDEYTCFNFGLSSQVLSYDERVLEAYQDNLAPGAVVVINISYFTFWGSPETDAESFESKNKRYYKFLPVELIKNYNLYTDILVSKLPVISEGPLAVVDALSNSKIDAHSIKSYPEVYTTADTIDIDAYTELAYQRHIVDKRDGCGVAVLNEEEVQALYDMVEICRKHNATPILVTVPYLEEYTDTIAENAPDFYEMYYEWVDSITKELSVDYFDYSKDERFSHDYQLFTDSDHMNSIGARKFTDILFEEVIKERLK